jgi:hypothetical protein
VRFLANYWWLLVLPVAVWLWLRSVRQTSRTQWVWVLRIAGGALVVASVTWFITGDIENAYISMHIGGGWLGATGVAALGIAALVGAQRWASKPPPPV